MCQPRIPFISMFLSTIYQTNVSTFPILQIIPKYLVEEERPLGQQKTSPTHKFSYVHGIQISIAVSRTFL